jgi:Mg2+ and Co2+ transporter CorA
MSTKKRSNATSLDDLKRAVDEFFADRSRTARETGDALQDLQDHIEVMIESLPAADCE